MITVEDSFWGITETTETYHIWNSTQTLYFLAPELTQIYEGEEIKLEGENVTVVEKTFDNEARIDGLDEDTIYDEMQRLPVSYYVRNKRVRVTLEYEFFFPGVTSGISFPGAIPPVDAVDHDFKLLEKILENGDNLIIDVGEVKHIYPGVYQRVIVRMRAAELYD
jgi:hypothetical protein